MFNRRNSLIYIIIICSISISIVVAASSVGSVNIELYGGTRGNVPFPHRMHQEKLGDCNLCHNFFQESKGAIEDLKEKGVLEKQQIMKKLCIDCHKKERLAGNPYGPTTCLKCHIKQGK